MLDAPAATTRMILGFLESWLVAMAVSLVLTLALVRASGISFSLLAAFLAHLMIFLPGLLFAGTGVVVSQLAATRQRAVLYGVVPLLGFFLLRGVANADTGLHWLMPFTPFGWAELVNPVLAANPWWLLPFVSTSLILFGLGIRWAQRDVGSALIPQSETTRPRYFLLGNGWQLALRQSMGVFAGWALSAVAVAALVTSLSTIAIQATGDSPTLAQSLGQLAGNTDDMKVAFIGIGLIVVVMLLMSMAVTIMNGIRSDEAREYLDAILVQPYRRTAWLLQRLLLGAVVTLAVAVAAGLVTYAIGIGQHVDIAIGKVLATSVCLVGTAWFLLGLGTLVYGIRPHWVGTVLYALLAWSFLLTMISSVTHLSNGLLHTSLFYYTSFNLAAMPDWGVFAGLLAAGAVLAFGGIVTFARRDIVAN